MRGIRRCGGGGGKREEEEEEEEEAAEFEGRFGFGVEEGFRE